MIPILHCKNKEEYLRVKKLLNKIGYIEIQEDQRSKSIDLYILVDVENKSFYWSILKPRNARRIFNKARLIEYFVECQLLS